MTSKNELKGSWAFIAMHLNREIGQLAHCFHKVYIVTKFSIKNNKPRATWPSIGIVPCF